MIDWITVIDEKDITACTPRRLLHFDFTDDNFLYTGERLPPTSVMSRLICRNKSSILSPNNQETFHANDQVQDPSYSRRAIDA
ncbi:MAG: hypothetical protein WBQ23_00750, partial [Bacteroidota bacterium]